jgi:melanoma-associated antigen
MNGAVFGGRATRAEFQPVFERAQHILSKTFGMELHEIMSRAERDRADAAREGAQVPDGEANVTGIKKKGTCHAGRWCRLTCCFVATTVSSKQYILRSTLDSTIIEAASVFDIEIEDAEKAELALWQPNSEECRPEYTLLTWRHGSADQLGMAGILHVILALILVNGRVLTDSKRLVSLSQGFLKCAAVQLRTYLKRLRLPMGSAVPSNASSQLMKPLTIDAHLAQLVKQNYLDKQKTSLASTQGAQKRGRGGGVLGGADEGDASFEWKWGTRAIAEIGEEGVGSFVVDFMDGIERERGDRRAEEDGARGSSRQEREMGEKRKDKILTAIGRAAGGGLVPYT